MTWWPEFGIGYHHYPLPDSALYNQDYFDDFESKAKTALGQALMAARCDFVHRHYDGMLIDVGIGSGAFIEMRERGPWVCGSTYGYDINPVGRRWLDENDLFADPYVEPFKAMSLWDVLEHIPDFQPLLANVSEWLFLSLPIFRDAQHALTSKHFKPGEHYWYFTRDGIVYAMKLCGFELISESKFETVLGREDIGTFAFQRMVR
jgi:hypothetical protein